uniref:Trypanosoma vivax n=1 Tax=Trypanosoma vivax (strain Y486) TaxID=1055687 RepID=G0U9D8_TRYVY|nr:Trypanosoma vivax [Trypanosoma vivax Y486]
MPQRRLGFTIFVVVFALRQCNEAPSQPGGILFYNGEGPHQTFRRLLRRFANDTDPLHFFGVWLANSQIRLAAWRMQLRRLKHIAPRRGEAPQGLVVEAAPCPLQRQSPLFLLGGRSGNPSAPQSTAAIKKRHWHPAFARGPCGRPRQFDHARRALLMRAVNFAELFKTAAQCPGHRAVPHGSPGGPACFPSCVGALGSKSRSTAAAAACACASGFIEYAVAAQGRKAFSKARAPSAASRSQATVFAISLPIAAASAPAITTQRAALRVPASNVFGSAPQSSMRVLRSRGRSTNSFFRSSAISSQRPALTHASRTAARPLSEPIALQKRSSSHRVIGRARLVGFSAAGL